MGGTGKMELISTILAAIGTIIFWVRWNDHWKLYKRITGWKARAVLPGKNKTGGM
jgi:hypothetical protein